MKKYCVAIISMILAVSLCSCGAGVAAPESTTAPSITATASPTPEPSPTPSPSPSPTPVPTPTPEPTPSTMWGANFPGKFTDGEIIKNDGSVSPTLSALSLRFQNCTVEVIGTYKSEHVNVTVNKVQEEGITYYVADIYITDLEYFISPFSDGEYDKGSRKFVYKMAQELNAVIAINGDYYTNNDGPVLRDGVLYRNEVKMDILVMFNDGTMKTYTKDEYDEDTIEAMEDDVWQIWTFGPMLLQDGEPMSEFNLPKKIGGVNPRTAVGYFEPGHYAFIVVDGRQPGYSDPGYTMEELSQLMYDLGCKVAFNLDGGGTSQMSFMGEWTNQSSVHRKTRDALCIVDDPGQ